MDIAMLMPTKIDDNTTCLFSYSDPSKVNRGYKICEQIIKGTTSKTIHFMAIEGDSIPIVITRDLAIDLIMNEAKARKLAADTFAKRYNA